MYQMTLYLKTPRPYRVIALACYRYSSETTRERDLKLSPISSEYLEGSSVYSYRNDLTPLSSSYCPWFIKISIKSLPTSLLQVSNIQSHDIIQN